MTAVVGSCRSRELPRGDVAVHQNLIGFTSHPAFTYANQDDMPKDHER